MTGPDEPYDDPRDELGDAMGEVRRGVEALVRVPPYALVLHRHHRRRRRRAGAGGLVLAAVVALGFVAVPGLVGHAGRRGLAPTDGVSVSVAPATGRGSLTLQDVSFATPTAGTVLGRRCVGAACHDVTLASSDAGAHYGPEVTVPGTHRFVAAAGNGLQIAYAPDLAVSTDGGGSWTALAAPAPVADVSVDDGQLLVLLVPTGRAAQLWSGPESASGWAAYAEVGRSDVPGSDDTARLARPSDGTILVTSSPAGRQPTVTTGVVSGPATEPAVAWTSAAVTPCGVGSSASLSALSGRTWWVACRDQVTAAAKGSRAAQGETVAYTQDGGASYTSAGPPGSVSTSADQEVTATAPDTAYLSGGDALLVTRDGGTLWTRVFERPGLGEPHIPAGAGGADVWVVAPGTGSVYRSTGGGFSELRLQ